LFSIMIGCGKIVLKASPTILAEASTNPPGGTGTTNDMGLDG